MIIYEVQGRRAATGVRLATAHSVDAALVAAGDMVGQGYTAWIFETRPLGAGRQYRLLRTVKPGGATS